MSRFLASDPVRDRTRDAFKRKSRAFIWRIVLRLSEWQMDRDEIARVWDAPIGEQWFWLLMTKARQEAVGAP